MITLSLNSDLSCTLSSTPSCLARGQRSEAPVIHSAGSGGSRPQGRKVHANKLREQQVHTAGEVAQHHSAPAASPPPVWP